MASSFEKSVKGATKIKAAPPKTKYIEHILIATHSGEYGVAEVFRSLQNRLRDSTWTVVFKSLITVHLMIREGSPDVTLDFLAKHRNMLAISSFSDASTGNAMETVLTKHGKVQTQGRNIRHYANYLTERAKAYRDTKCDFVRGAEHRLEKLSVDKGLLRETEIVQNQISSLLKCDVLDNEPENEITITVFRMLVLDLLAMFHVVNQAMINILGHFFEMSRSDAERALGIYLDFTKQTESVVSYLSTARQFQHQTRVEVPKLKHAPTNLGKQLEDYLADPDFEINRRQYLAEQEAKKGKGTSNGISKPSMTNSKNESESRAATGRAFPEPSSSQPSSDKPAPQAKGPDPDLIDFFDSIEQNQQPMATQAIPQSQQVNTQNYGGVPPFQVPQQQHFQQNGFGASQTVYQGSTPFMQQQPIQTQGIQSQQAGPLQPNFTGAGFGGYTPQPSFSPTSLSPIPQDNVASFQGQNVQPFGNMNTGQPQSNPFRQSMMAASQTGMSTSSFPTPPPTTSPITQQNTNPFKTMSGQNQQVLSPPPEQQFQQVQQGPFAGNPLQPAPTGTNPFARSLNPSTTQSPPAAGTLMPQQTGSTNPFRQSQFVNTATGTGWQHNQLPIGGGLDHLETVPVFPRPTQQQPWQQ